jgi:hypothetical protein
MKSGSDNIGIFLLYGTAPHGCQGADRSCWYREDGLSEHDSDMTGGCLAATQEHAGDAATDGKTIIFVRVEAAVL